MKAHLKQVMLALPVTAAILSFSAMPASAQYYDPYYYGSTSYYSTPVYSTPVYSTPVYSSYSDDYGYRTRTNPLPAMVTGAAVGGLGGFGLSFLERRHHRHFGRNIGIGAGVGAGVGLLGNMLGGGWF